MTLLFQYLLWIAVAAVFYSYVVYPLLLKALGHGKTPNTNVYAPRELPFISILIAAHNEEKVIEEKLMSIFNGHYPVEKFEILVGSDCSTDRTAEITEQLCKKHSNLKLIQFKERTGKVRIINQLAAISGYPILVITDANIIFDKETLVQVARHFKNNDIALVDTNMLHKGLKKEGISYEESFYIRGEVSTKYYEGMLWGTMMGPFGGCYAIRKEYFSPVPGNLLVDDFYINMKILEKGGKAITEVNALVYEDVSNKLMEEFRRKIRIATGNFQNLFIFQNLLFGFNATAFCFFSHKVLRWFGPQFFLLIYFCTMALIHYTRFYFYVFGMESLLLALIAVDYILEKVNVHLRALRLLRHFFFMNFALFTGMLKAMAGVKSSIWEPTQRNQ